jgi:hypothetical protein
MSLGTISLSTIFDNRSFVRQLTAYIVSPLGPGTPHLTGNFPVSWLYDSLTASEYPVAAFNRRGEYIFSDGIYEVSAVNPAIFVFFAPTYDYTQQNYQLFTQRITAETFTNAAPPVLLTTAVTSVSYDTFPEVDINICLNYENTEFNNQFYRYTSPTRWPLLSAGLTKGTQSFTFSNETTTGSNFQYWYTLNRDLRRTLPYTLLSTITGFNRPTPCLSSLQIYVSANTANNSLCSWYTSHIFEQSISAVFVDSLRPANPFIVFPGTRFINAYTQIELSAQNINQSPGPGFYGEGHTQLFFLSTDQNSDVFEYKWSFGNYDSTLLPLVTSLEPVRDSAIAVRVPTNLGEYGKIPVAVLEVRDIDTNGYYIDDTTGQEKPYPIIFSTVDEDGNDLSSNNTFIGSISVNPYDEQAYRNYIFKTNIPQKIYLPVDLAVKQYTAQLQTALSAGLPELTACYDKFGQIWKWSMYESCSSAIVPISSWNTTALTGITPKKWGNEGPLFAEKYNFNPIFCYTGPITWTLSTSKWSYSYIDNLTPENSFFTINLRLSGYGNSPLTVSFYNEDKVTVGFSRTLSCVIPAAPGDWQIKESEQSVSFDFETVPPPIVRFYTPNRYVLADKVIRFQNVTERTELLSALEINLDENKTITLTGDDVKNDIFVSYSIVGYKTIKVTAKTTYSPVPLVFEFPKIVNIVTQYDTVSPDNYRSLEASIELPYPKSIGIAPNEWGTADIFNSCVEKFYSNLEYLQTRGFTYKKGFTDRFGWLGVPPVTLEGLELCDIYTWEDLDCSLAGNENFLVTWSRAATSETVVGDFSTCLRWNVQTCTQQEINPGCLGLHKQQWNWRARKLANAQVPITWSQTKTSAVYQKRWYFEPNQVVQTVPCDEGVWNVNLPGLNTFYYPIRNCIIARNCDYTSVASVNNNLYLAQKTQLKVLSSDYTATFYSFENTLEGATAFNNIKTIRLDSNNKVFVLDPVLAQVGVYTVEENNDWSLFVNWGGVGSFLSKSRFFKPNDLHIDQFDDVWVADTGNSSIKHYSNTGGWKKTVYTDRLTQDTPISICIDSQKQLHVLTANGIQVYSYEGEFLFSYNYSDYVNEQPIRINTSYNREIIYLCTPKQVIKFFRNGTIAGYIINSEQCVENITDIYQDEFRNLYITSGDKVLKYVDRMELLALKGSLPDWYWKLEDLYIHEDEYVQNWVYNKALHRLWDNIEILRSTIYYNTETGSSRTYELPKYSKDEIFVGQNEIVTSTVINRSFNYLQENLNGLIKAFETIGL